MSITVIEPEHLQSYVDRVYSDHDVSNDLRKLPLDFLYEALCETIVNHNESYEMKNMTEEWIDSELDAEEFVAEKFDAVVSSETEAIVPIQHRYKWISAGVVGMYEISDEHSYQNVPE